MNIAVIGAGYVGLTSGTCFAEFGLNVICSDKDEAKINLLNQGKIPIYEPELDKIMVKNIEKGLLTFTVDLSKAIKDAQIVFIAVGTPSRLEDGRADLRHIFAAVEEVAHHIKDYKVIAVKSTVPVGTSRRIAEVIHKINPKAQFSVVSNPEFLREGSAISDFMKPARVIIGASDERATEIMRELYTSIYPIKTPILFTTLETSELIKYATNAFLATKVAFINEIADLCEQCGADVQTLANGMGLDDRIGAKFLHPGPGFGGSCFPKDIQALTQTAVDYNVPIHIVESVITSNKERKYRMAEKVVQACGGMIKGKTIAVLGVTFKPNTDDIRESASLIIIPTLQKMGATIQAFDPAGKKNAESLLPNTHWFMDPYSAMSNADAIVILTEWDNFRHLNLMRIKDEAKHPMIIDFRNIYNPIEMMAVGFDYYSIGRQPVYGYTNSHSNKQYKVANIL